METHWVEPGENDSVECHLQQVGMGTLICRAATKRNRYRTNEVTPSICFNCEVGKIYREVGCDSASPRILIHAGPMGPGDVRLLNILCQRRKRLTDLNECRSCDLVTAPTTRQLVTTARDLFQREGFHSAYRDLEKARAAMRDGEREDAITSSIACLESTMRICHERLGAPLPREKDLTGLWKSSRELLKLAAFGECVAVTNLVNTMFGVVSHLGGVRNELSNAHGKGLVPPRVSEAIAELALNTAMTLSTFLVRCFHHTEARTDDPD